LIVHSEDQDGDSHNMRPSLRLQHSYAFLVQKFWPKNNKLIN